jgi:Mg2+/Co2+ transporter CorB
MIKSAFFSASETALTAFNRSKLRVIAEKTSIKTLYLKKLRVKLEKRSKPTLR